MSCIKQVLFTFILKKIKNKKFSSPSFSKKKKKKVLFTLTHTQKKKKKRTQEEVVNEKLNQDKNAQALNYRPF